MKAPRLPADAVCCRCDRPAVEQWRPDCCALDDRRRKKWLPLCAVCDVELNEITVRFFFGSAFDLDLALYRKERLTGKQP